MKTDQAYEDQRSENRIAGSFRLFVHIQDCESEPKLVGKSIACEAVDVSKQGIQVATNVGVPMGTRLSLAVAIGQPFAMYLLEGEVRWQQDIEEESRMGILLLQGRQTDYEKWKNSFDTTVAWIDYLEASGF